MSKKKPAANKKGKQTADDDDWEAILAAEKAVNATAAPVPPQPAQSEAPPAAPTKEEDDSDDDGDEGDGKKKASKKIMCVSNYSYQSAFYLF